MARMMGINKKVMLIIVASIILTTLLFLSISHGGKKMQSFYNINETKTLKPEEYDLKADMSFSLFPVPQENSIGTNDLSNAITLLSFQHGKIKYDKYFKCATDDVEGGGVYIPVVAPDTIGFGQTRRFLLYNFRTRDVREFEIVVSLEKTIEKIAIADAVRRHFIFEIEAGNPRSEDPWDVTYNLLLIDLSGKERKLIKELNIGKATIWTAAFNKIFLHDLKTEHMKILTTNFAEQSPAGGCNQ